MTDKKKILLVDDEQDILDLVTPMLVAQGYDVITAADGLAGLDKARSEKPDLIILDLMLPKMDGYTVCSLLKHDYHFKEIPVILFTARVQESDRKMGEEMGADAYIPKPFEPDALISKINELLAS